jgi:hypothetical protein
MPAPLKTPKTVADMEAHSPGGDAFVFPDLPDMMSGWMTLATSNLQAWQSEWTNFVATRIEHDRLTLQRLASCRDLMEAAKVQQDWFAEATASYLEEGRRFAAIASTPDRMVAKAKPRVAAE